MTNLKVKNRQLAKLREFRKGMDVEEFLQTEYRQVLRALQNQYVDRSSNYIESDSCGSFSTAVAADVTNLSVEYNSNGGLVVIGLRPEDADNAYVSVSNSASNTAYGNIQLFKDGTVTDNHQIKTLAVGATNVSIGLPPSSISFLDNSFQKGMRTYKVRASPTSGTIELENVKLFVYEIF